jgi:hypothetical protein
MTTPATTEPVDRLLERVVIGGDLSGLSALEKTKHYIRVCRSMGLNPYTKPFAYLKLQGRETLYATKDCADQLRAIHRISIELVSRELTDGIYTVRARSSDPAGRRDEDDGSVPLPDSVKGEFRSNLMMKATTKAKRRVTLSHCGLGFLDETEIGSIGGAETAEAPSPEQLTIAEDMRDEIPELHADAGLPAASVQPASVAAAAQETTSPPVAAAALSVEDMAREAALRGPDTLRAFFNSRNAKEKAQLRKIENELVSLYPAPGRMTDG